MKKFLLIVLMFIGVGSQAQMLTPPDKKIHKDVTYKGNQYRVEYSFNVTKYFYTDSTNTVKAYPAKINVFIKQGKYYEMYRYDLNGVFTWKNTDFDLPIIWINKANK